MSDENQRMQELYQRIGFKPTPRLHQVIETGLSEAHINSSNGAFLTVPYLILGILFVGKHRPQDREFVTQFYQAISSDDTDTMTRRVNQRHAISTLSNPASGIPWVSSEFLDILIESAPSNLSENVETSETSTEDIIVTLLEKRPKECQMIFDQDVDIWTTLLSATRKAVAGLTVSESFENRLRQLEEASRRGSTSSEKSNPQSTRPPSTSIKEWRLYLENRYGKQFTDGAIRIIIAAVEAAEKDRGHPNNLKTINTKQLLIPLAQESGPLRTLHLENPAESSSGIRPWYEPQSDADEFNEARTVYGKTRPSVEFATILQTAAGLTETTIGFPEVTEWHLAFAAISLNANGLNWQLHAQNSSLTAGAIILRRNLASRQPQLEPLFNWSDLEDDFEPFPEEGVNEPNFNDESRSRSRAFQKLRKPESFRWSVSCERSLDALWHSYGLAAAFAQQSDLRAKRFNPQLTSRSLLLACLRRGASDDRSKASGELENGLLLRDLFRAAGKTIDQIDELLRDEFHRGREDSARDNASPLVSKELTRTIELANEIRLGTGNDSYVCSRHLIAALLCFSKVGETTSNLLIASDGIDPNVLFDILTRAVASAPLGISYDDPDRWIPWLESIQEGLADTLPDSRPTHHNTEPIGGKTNLGRGASESELCLDIGPYSAAIAETFHSAAKVDDFVFALYGPWGRGKTQMARAVASHLEEKDCTTIFFSAWKFPSRPEVWVHLYQTISKAALEGDWRHRMRVSFQAGILHNGWFSLILALIFLVVSRLTGWVAGWLADGIGFIGVLMIVFLAIRAHSAGRSIYQRYLTLPDHADKLGLQAVIGNDLASLLKVWVKPPIFAPERVMPQDSALADIDFESNGAGRIKRNWSIGLLIAACLLAGIQVWLSTPKSFEEVTPVSIKVLQTNVTELSDEIRSLGTRLDTAKKKLENDLHNLSSKALPLRELATGSKQPEREFDAAKISKTPNSQDKRTDDQSAETDQEKSPLSSALKDYGAKTFVSILLLTIAIGGSWLLLVASRTPTKTSKVLLVVDDLDRCEPDQMLAVIESLRMFLDDREMSARLQVMMLLDLSILELALKERCRNLGIPTKKRREAFVTEQREKWFVSELALPPLSDADLKKAVTLIVDREVEAALQKANETEHQPKPHIPNQPQPRRKNSDQGYPTGATVDEDMKVTGADGSNEERDSTPSSPLQETTPTKGVLEKETERPDTQNQNAQAMTWSDDYTYDRRDREAIKRRFVSLEGANATPRHIRSLTLRYQLARLILRHLGANPDPDHILECLLEPNKKNSSVPTSVRNVAQAVSGKRRRKEAKSNETTSPTGS